MYERNVVDLQFCGVCDALSTSEATEGWIVIDCSLWVRAVGSARDVLYRRPFELQYQTKYFE